MRSVTAALVTAMLAVWPAFAAETRPDAMPDAATTLEFANGLYSRKMYGPAISEYEKFLSSSPNSPEAASARFRYADSYYFTKNYKSAAFYFERFAKEHPDDKRVPMAELRIAASRFQLGETAEAVRLLLPLSEKAADPNVRGAALYYLAQCYQARGAGEKALETYRKLLKHHPSSEYASYAATAVGDALAEGERYDEAIAAYRIAAENKHPLELSRAAAFKTAEILFLQKKWADARKRYESLYAELPAGNALKSKALLGLFYCDYHEKDLAAAEKRLATESAVIERAPERADIHYMVAALLEEKKERVRALEFLERVLTEPGADPDLVEKALFKKSAILSELERRPEAITELEKVLARAGSPNQPRARFEKAALLEAAERFSEALAEHERLANDHPANEFGKAALYRSAALKLKLGDPKEARRRFAAFAEKHPKHENAEEALLEAAQIDLDAKDFAAASAASKKFLETYPQSEFSDIALYKLAVALTGLGRFDEAAARFESVVSAHPRSKLFAESLYGAAASHESAGKLKNAVPFYERLTAGYADNPLAAEALQRLGYLYIRTRDLQKASAFYQGILLEKPFIPLNADAVFWLVRHLLESGEYAALEKILGVLPQRFPESEYGHEIYFFAGENAMGRKDYAKAAAHYSQSVQLKPDGPYAAHAHLGMGLAHALTGQNEAASKEFAEALRFDGEPKVAMRARFEIASLKLREAKLGEAAKAFMLVAILYDDPKYTPLSLYKAGECFEKLGKPDEAGKAFAELMERYPDSNWARKYAHRKAA